MHSFTGKLALESLRFSAYEKSFKQIFIKGFEPVNDGTAALNFGQNREKGLNGQSSDWGSYSSGVTCPATTN